MRTATALLTPSVVAKTQDRESGLIVAKETAAFGFSVIGTYHGRIPEMIDDGMTDYLVPEHEHDTMGARLTELPNDAKLRSDKGQAARHKMEHEYGIVERPRVL
ncbi:MAG: glycosyltransferase [Myxococcota bacterium]|nr:glycosyltransferase [Myxococcota bacterium]